METYIYHDSNGFYFKEFEDDIQRHQWETEDLESRYFIGDADQFIRETRIVIAALEGNKNYKELVR